MSASTFGGRMPSEDQVRAAQALRLGFLSALYDRENAGEASPPVDAVARDIGLDPADRDAIVRVTQPLHQDGLIGGASAWGGGVLRPRLEASGRRLVESRMAGQQPPSGSPASISDVRIDGTGNIINIQQHSPGAEQHAEITGFDRRKMLDWAHDVERRASAHRGLDEKDLADIGAQVVRLREELGMEQPEPGTVHAAGRFILRVLESGSASLASNGLIEVGRALFG